jgi:glycogen debranching enzyme
MTYLTELIGYATNGLELISGGSGRDYKFKNLLSGHNLSSYNKIMLIFQHHDTSYWKAKSIKIIVLNKNESVPVNMSGNAFINISGASYNNAAFEFKNNELCFRLNIASTSSNPSLYISDMTAIGINE